MKRTASAHWEGTGRDGHGSLSSASEILNKTPYSFATRFGDQVGTNPEELIAAAHAGCFTMALSFALQGAGYNPTSLDTQAVITMEKDDSGFTIKSSELELAASVPGLDIEEFQSLAKGAKENCPVSRVLNADISLSANLV